MDRHGAADYREQLWQLMPRGLAWSRKPDGEEDRLLAGLAEELARMDARAIELCLKEFYAISTRELLPDWEIE
ncbi:MAG: YmfQ family protein, partial [Planctomycetota bacterium]|nr:YmfQ family protein [Planctomycetota bacterium]